MLSIITRVYTFSDSILCRFIIWEQMAQFLFHRKYLGNDKKKIIEIGKLLIIIWFLFFIFSTSLEIGSLFFYCFLFIF